MVGQFLHLSHLIDLHLRQDETVVVFSPAPGFEPSTYQRKSLDQITVPDNFLSWHHQ